MEREDASALFVGGASQGRGCGRGCERLGERRGRRLRQRCIEPTKTSQEADSFGGRASQRLSHQVPESLWPPTSPWILTTRARSRSHYVPRDAREGTPLERLRPEDDDARLPFRARLYARKAVMAAWCSLSRCRPDISGHSARLFHCGRCQLKTAANLLHLRADEYSSWPELKEVKPQVDCSVACV